MGRVSGVARRTGVFQLLAGFLIDDAHREAHLATAVDLEHLDLHLLPFGHDVGRLLDPLVRISETWTRPSLPPMKFTNAPKSTMFTTLPL
jgi:hypothetical protein